MKRPRTTSFAASSPSHAQAAEPESRAESSWRELAPVVAVLIATLDTMEVGPKAGPAVKVHRSALRRQGEAAAAIGGTEAMKAALCQIEEADPARAEGRTRIICEAWAGLTG